MGEVRVGELGDKTRRAGGLGLAVDAVKRPADSATDGFFPQGAVLDGRLGRLLRHAALPSLSS